MPKGHFIVLQTQDGAAEYHPLKQWLRENRQYLPPGYDPDVNTSHELRNALKKKGWTLKELDDRVLIIKPDVDLNLVVIESEDHDEEEIEDSILEADEITFGLERDLQIALRKNIEQLEPGLKIIDGGAERITDAGRIDITAIDKNGNILVIELKAGSADPRVVAQVLAYMGCVAETDQKPVRGFIVAGDFHKRVILAARAVPNLDLKKYAFQFSFENVN